MQKINTPDGNWHAGDPSQGIKGSVVTREFMQAVQDELVAVPESVGIKLDPADNKQVLKAIQKIVADAGANYQPKLDYTPVQQGTGVGQGANTVKMGWAKDGSGLRVTVDTNDLGLLAFASQLAAYASQDWVKGYAVNKAGDTMTGTLTIAVPGGYSGVVLSASGYTPRIQTDGAGKFVGVVNGANTAVNMWVYDGGQVSTRSNLTVGGTTVGGGANATVATDGNVYGPVWGGWLSTYLSNTYVSCSVPRMSDRLIVSRDGWQADIQLQNLYSQNSNVYLRARVGGGLDIINSAYNGVPWQVSDGGETWQNGTAHVGGASFQTDGNVWGAAWGNDYASNVVARKANAGARVQWDSGIVEFDWVGSNNSVVRATIDLPAPYVVTGLRVAANPSIGVAVIWQRGAVLRNQ
ncbi:TPA: hypothetical protein QDB15_001068 [Burkholderia vietnamiensis]|uniref:hypothetical protein n=1 Tax=Burkholderia vietnamiensis TaxID=60552 RepID=UPI001CF4D7FE|nr:hypothetical protein [Burkholderia vietnamiensis]MCA8212157.1 hypothetical protein [Burkholderia vietnamiensis]HDR9117324.1 hypothetical protein [Burkholderia vietnamiensis]